MPNNVIAITRQLKGGVVRVMLLHLCRECGQHLVPINISCCANCDESVQ